MEITEIGFGLKITNSYQRNTDIKDIHGNGNCETFLKKSLISQVISHPGGPWVKQTSVKWMSLANLPRAASGDHTGTGIENYTGAQFGSYTL